MDKLIVQELIEDVKLLHQELVEGINYCTHNSNSMSLDRVKHLVDSDCLDLLGLCRDLNENLGVDIIGVLTNKLSQVSQQL